MNILKKTTTSLITAFALIFSPMMLADVSGSRYAGAASQNNNKASRVASGNTQIIIRNNS